MSLQQDVSWNGRDFCITYDIVGAEPDVGIMGDYAEIEKVELYYTTLNGKALMREIRNTSQQFDDYLNETLCIEQDYDEDY